MKFGTLQIENFLGIGKIGVDLNDRGLVAIMGRNDDDTSASSNGAGKSSIADALCWVLFGTTARGASANSVVNTSAGKDTRVSIVLHEGDQKYIISRHRKHRHHKNSLRVHHQATRLGEWKELTAGTDTLTQDIVNRAIGCSYEVFRAAIYAGQEQMPDLPAMTDKQLKVLIEEAAGIEILERAYERARSAAQDKTEHKKTVQALISAIESRIRELEDSLKDFETKSQAYEETEADRVRKLAESGKEHKATIARLKTAFKTVVGGKSVSDLQDLIHKLDEKIAESGGERLRERELDEVVVSITSDLTTLTSKRNDTGARLKKAAAKFRAVDHQIGCPCEACGRPLTADEIAPTKNAARSAVIDLKSDFDALSSAIETAQGKLASAIEARDAFVRTMTDVSATIVARASLQEQVDKAKTILSEIKRENIELEGIERTMTSRPANPYLKLIAETEGKIASAKANHSEAAKIFKKAVEREAIDASVVKVFAPGGIRARILDDVTPFLNDRTQHYLTTLSDGNIRANWSTLVKTAKGELREKFSIEVSRVGGADGQATLSGGERRKVRIATALAMQDLVSRRAAKPLDLFIGDEIDDALDDAGLERLTTILEEKARERGSVFIISHNDLKDWVSNTITVVRSGGNATLE